MKRSHEKAERDEKPIEREKGTEKKGEPGESEEERQTEGLVSRH